MANEHAPVARQQHGKGPRTKRQARLRRAAREAELLIGFEDARPKKSRERER